MNWIHGLLVLFPVVIWGDVHGQLRSPYQVRLSVVTNDDFRICIP